MSTYQPDAKTLIRHAMVALEDEMGINEADQFTSRLRQLFTDIRNWQDEQQRRGHDSSNDTPGAAA